MAVRRNSTSLVSYFGAEVSARIQESKLDNVVKNGQGTELSAEAASQRYFNQGFGPSSLNIDEYQYMLGFLQSIGTEPLAAKAMAVVFVDAAKAQGTTAMQLVKDITASELALITNETYDYINRLRPETSQLAGTASVDNTKSFRSRYIKP